MFSLSKLLGVKKEDKGLLYRAYLAFFFSGMMANALGSILPSIIETYNLSLAFQGTLLSINQIGNLLAVWLSGFLPYAIGRKRSTVILGSGVVIGFLIMTLTGNPIMLLIAFTCLGIGRGTMSNITNVVVGQYAGNKAMGLNLLHGTFAVGAFLSPFVVIIAGPEHWRVPALVIALGMAIALTLFVFSSLSNKREVKAKDDSAIPRALSFWINTFIMFFYLCGEATFMGWMVTYFKNSGIFPTSIANIMSSLLWVMILIGRLLCASLSNKVNKNYLILAMGVLMVLFTVLMVSTENSILVVIGVLGVGLFMSGIYPTTLSTMEKRFNQSTIATGTCIATATLGSIIMPIIVGNVADAISIRVGLRVVLVPLCLMVLLMIVKVFYSKRHPASES